MNSRFRNYAFDQGFLAGACTEKAWHGTCLKNSSTYYSEVTLNPYCPEPNIITSFDFSSLPLYAKGIECVEYIYRVFTGRTSEYHGWCRQAESHASALTIVVTLLNRAQDPVNVDTWVLAGLDGLTSACKTFCRCSPVLPAEAEKFFHCCQLTAGPEQDIRSSGNKKCQDLTSWASPSSKITATSHWLAAPDYEWTAHLRTWWGKPHRNSLSFKL